MSYPPPIPYCGDTCIAVAYEESGCGLNNYCLCTDQTYLAAVRACISPCDTGEWAPWIQYSEGQCAAVGVTLTAVAAASTSPLNAATTISPNAATTILPNAATTSPSNVATFVSVQLSTSVFVVASTAAASSAGSTIPPQVPAASTAPLSANSDASTPVDQSSGSSGLPSGSAAGIAIGVVIIVLLAAACSFFLRRNRNLPAASTGPGETTNVYEVDVESRGAGGAGGGTVTKELMAPVVTVSSVAHPPELPQGEKRRSVPPEPLAKPLYDGISPPSAMTEPTLVGSPSISNSTMTAHQLSPMSTYTELPSTIPTPHPELPASSPSTPAAEMVAPNVRPPPSHVAETDSHLPSHSVVSEFDGTESSPSAAAHAYPIYHELASSPAQGTEAAMTAAVAGSNARGDEEEDDTELTRMKAEMECVRIERERQMGELEERERELSRKIVERELRTSRGPGWPS